MKTRVSRAPAENTKIRADLKAQILTGEKEIASGNGTSWSKIRREVAADPLSLETIKNAFTQLSPKGREAFRDWIDEYEADLVDQKLEQAVSSGAFDQFAKEALAEHRAGRSRPL